jgi:hypothetical protein
VTRRSTHPRSCFAISPAAVRNAPLAARGQYVMPGDPDGFDEGVLNVTGF